MNSGEFRERLTQATQPIAQTPAYTETPGVVTVHEEPSPFGLEPAYELFDETIGKEAATSEISFQDEPLEDDYFAWRHRISILAGLPFRTPPSEKDEE